MRSIKSPPCKKKGIEGVEAFSTYHSDEQNRALAEQAQSLGMLISCGSDFHGRVKPTIQLGQLDDTGYASDIAHALDQIIDRMKNC